MKRQSIQLELQGSRCSQLRATTAQEYFWSMASVDPDPTAYHTTQGHILAGAIDKPTLQRCMSTLVEAHSVFRTAVRDVDGELRQVVLGLDEAPRFELELIDRTCPASEWKDEGQRIIGELVGRGFDLAAGRVLWATLAQLGPNHHALVVVFHHIVSDLASINYFFARLFDMYESAAKGGAIEESPALQYIDVAQALERWSQTPPGQAQAAYWKARVASAQPMQVPAEFPRDDVDARHAAARSGITADAMYSPKTVNLMDELREAVTVVARKNRVTIFGVYLSVLLWILHERTGQTDLCVETTLDLRALDNRLASVVGPLTSWTLLRVDASGCASLRDLLPTVGKAIAEAKENGPIADYYRVVPHSIRRVVVNYLPVRWLQRASKTPAQSQREPVVESSFGYSPNWKRPWDLHMTVYDAARTSLIWTGNKSLFSKETLDALLETYIGALKSATAPS